jgi:hypothetical protein
MDGDRRTRRFTLWAVTFDGSFSSYNVACPLAFDVKPRSKWSSIMSNGSRGTSSRTAVTTKTLTTEERKRLIAMLNRILKDTAGRSSQPRTLLDSSGIEYASARTGGDLTVHLYERHSTVPTLTFRLSRSITSADLAKLRDGVDPQSISDKTVRRLERRARTLDSLGQKVMAQSGLRNLMN